MKLLFHVSAKLLLLIGLLIFTHCESQARAHEYPNKASVTYIVQEGDNWTRLTVNFLKDAGVDAPIPYFEVVEWLQLHIGGGDDTLYVLEKVTINLNELLSKYRYTQLERAEKIRKLRSRYRHE
ncbi:hypothetical protein V6R21_18460 [Limibacter armeniacum]|uniref:hypothetical protein n=1 Tax=Limibacter armeniacum TaxID=466084 RepID=UPI002FE52517